jgi:hypothetical protein
MATAGELYTLVRHGLGKEPAPGHDLWGTINRAGRELMTRAQWSWLTVGPVQVPTVGGSEIVELPEDFGQIIAVWLAGNWRTVELTTVAEITRYLTTTLALPTSVKIAFDAWTPQGSPTSKIKPRALIWPKANIAQPQVLTMTYRRRWVDVSSRDPDALPSVPAEAEEALILLARAKAKLLENDEAASAERQAAEAEIQRLMAYDAMRQVNYGPMLGGAGRHKGVQEYTSPADVIVLQPTPLS